MGLLNNMSPAVAKGCSFAVMASLFAVFIAMMVTAPSDVIIGKEEDTKAINSGDTAWLMASCAVVLIMIPGLGFFYGGMVNSKNVVSTIMQAFLPLAVIPVVWMIVGFGLAYGASIPGSAGILGNPADFGGLMYKVGAAPFTDFLPTVPGTVFFIFQLLFAAITPSIIIGSVADRLNITSMCIFITLWHITVYCPIAHMVWHPTGLIRTFGVVDFAGGTVVHMASGYAGLMAAIYLGKSLSSASSHLKGTGEADCQLLSWAHSKEPANVPVVVLGTALLWFGWFGFNAGSAGSAGVLAGQAFLTTNTAAVTSMMGWILMDHLRGYKIRATGACIGAVIGLVAITPAAGVVNVGGAALIGLIGAIACSLAQHGMEKWGRKYVDDTLDVFACHGVGGTVGCILTSLFATKTVNAAGADGAFYGNPMLLGKTLLVLVIIVPWFCVFTWGCLWVTDKILSLRVSDEEEMMGLDISKHGERAASDMAVVQAIASASKRGSSTPSVDALVHV